MYGAAMGYLPAVLRRRQSLGEGDQQRAQSGFPGHACAGTRRRRICSRLRQRLKVEARTSAWPPTATRDRLALVDETGRSVDNFEVYPSAAASSAGLPESAWSGDQDGRHLVAGRSGGRAFRRAGADDRRRLQAHRAGHGRESGHHRRRRVGRICLWRPPAGERRRSRRPARPGPAGQVRQAVVASAGGLARRVRPTFLSPCRFAFAADCIGPRTAGRFGKSAPSGWTVSRWPACGRTTACAWTWTTAAGCCCACPGPSR